MNREFYNQTVANAVDTYGKNAQVDMAMEEMSELAKALFKERRTVAGTAYDNQNLLDRRKAIIEEIADVEIMLDQLKYIFICYAAVESLKIDKIERLAGRIKEYKSKLKSMSE